MVISNENKYCCKKSNISLKVLSETYIKVKKMFSFLSCLPISVRRILDNEANKFYDKGHQLYVAALLTRCYTQYALLPFIDSEVNHKRHFTKIPFLNKGIDFINRPSIPKDRSVTSSFPDYFEKEEPPILCFKYNKPIWSTLFYFNNFVLDLDIHTNTPDTQDSKYLLTELNMDVSDMKIETAHLLPS